MVPIHSETVQSALERRLAFEITVAKAASEKEILVGQDIKALLRLTSEFF